MNGLVDELRFDDRVAVVTGAGHGLGRAYARLLAARGAKVIVNDLAAPDPGATDAPADLVVAEIVAAGDEAISINGDVSSESDAAAIIDAAVDGFGRIDIVINNAGNMRWGEFPEVATGDLQNILAVHLFGSFYVTRSAWPHLVERGYGRIVNTTSTGMLGLKGNLAYATAKAGLIGMTRSMKQSGARHGINANLIAPAATVRGGPVGAMDADTAWRTMSPDLVAPMVAYLAHERCAVSGEVFIAGGGRFGRLFIASTQGWVADDESPTIEDVVTHWDEITDVASYYVPADLAEWASTFMSHLA